MSLFRALFEDLLLALFAMALPALMWWAHGRHYGDVRDDTVWLVRITSPILLPFGTVLWMILITHALGIRFGFMRQALVFLLTIGVEFMLLRNGIWI